MEFPEGLGGSWKNGGRYGYFLEFRQFAIWTFDEPSLCLDNQCYIVKLCIYSYTYSECIHVTLLFVLIFFPLEVLSHTKRTYTNFQNSWGTYSTTKNPYVCFNFCIYRNKLWCSSLMLWCLVSVKTCFFFAFMAVCFGKRCGVFTQETQDIWKSI